MGDFSPYQAKSIESKLAATTMNPHYHPYSELPSPHSPPPDAGGYANGHHVEHHFPHHHHHHHGNNGGVKVCAGCGGKIVERYLLHALDRYWHNSCLKCTCCGAMLADIGSSCFTKSNMILCKNDYIRLFGSTGACSGCGQTIPASEFVMRAAPHHVFHLKCFACSKCGSQLVPGDRYYMAGGSLVCEQDWHKLVKSPAPQAPPVRKGKVGRPRRSRD
nr:LIM domain transcription factor LMO4 isoform X1 [Halyomorpha halys]